MSKPPAVSSERSAERAAEVVRGILARRLIPQSELAKVLGLSNSSLSRRLRGTFPFSIAELEAVTDYLDVPMVSLFADDTSTKAAS